MTMTENSKGRQQLEIITDDNHYTKEKGTSKKSGRQTKVDAKEKGGRQREKWTPKRKADVKEKSGRQQEKRTPKRKADANEKSGCQRKVDAGEAEEKRKTTKQMSTKRTSIQRTRAYMAWVNMYWLKIDLNPCELANIGSSNWIVPWWRDICLRGIWASHQKNHLLLRVVGLNSTSSFK